MLLPLVLDLRQARGEAGRMLTPERRLVSRSVLAREARRRRVVRAVGAAAGPAHVCPQRHQRLHEDCGLHGAVDASGDSGARQWLQVCALGSLAPAGREPRHLAGRQVDGPRHYIYR
jgi:hypothetical protein